MRSVTRVALQPIAQGSACILEEQQQQQAEEEDAEEEDRKEAEGRERQAAQVSNKRSLNIISLHHQLLLLLLPVDGPALRIRNVQYFSASHKDFCKAGEQVRGRG